MTLVSGASVRPSGAPLLGQPPRGGDVRTLQSGRRAAAERGVAGSLKRRKSESGDLRGDETWREGVSVQ
jgi:hypothetical protein